jgi:hypothetical protein
MKPAVAILTLALSISGCATQDVKHSDHAGMPGVHAQAANDYKSKYHTWVAAIYRSPEIMYSSTSASYTNLPEYKGLENLSSLSSPFLAADIMDGRLEFSLFLGLALIRIQKWDESDFHYGSLQELNQKLVDRLISEDTNSREYLKTFLNHAK